MRRLLFLLLLPPSLCLGKALKTESRLVESFETAGGPPLASSAEAAVGTEGASEGGKALKMTFQPPGAYPNVRFPQEPAADFQGYGGLAFDVFNPGDETMAFAVRIDSSAEADGNGNHSRSGKGSIDGGQRATFVLPFGVDPAAMKMKALPGFGEFRSLGSSGSGPFDLGHIVQWQIFVIRPHSSQQLIVDNVRLLPGRKQDFHNIIDAYGQYTRADWPGKIKVPEDFAAQRAAEDQDLAAHRGLPDRNKYGGWTGGPQLKATGFFRVEKYEGRWAFVDPDGRLFLSFGPTTVGAGQSTPVTGREYLFSARPENDAHLANFQTGENKDGLDFLAANLHRKYGGDYKKIWYDRTYDRLTSWGFNTIGAFSSWDTLNNGKVPYSVTVWPGGKHARLSTGKEQVRSMHDPFDPQFAADVAGALKAQAARVKDDPFCLGYFVGNEEDWGHFRHGPKSHYGLVLSALKKTPGASPAKKAFLEQLKSKYGDIAKLNAAWGTSFPEWAALDAPVALAEPFRPEQQEDLSLLLRSLADQYFRVVQEEIRKADPNHLYLGYRFAGYSPEVLDAAAKFSDVFSFNIYRLGIEPKEWAVLDPWDKPVVIGEFHFGAVDRGVFDIGLIGVADQQSRARAYQNYVKSVLAHPKFVGAHWFQYTDQPTTGRAGDGENGNVGFVSIADTPYPELIDAARDIHAKMYPLRFRQ
jgi:hypothetical protein